MALMGISRTTFGSNGIGDGLVIFIKPVLMFLSYESQSFSSSSCRSITQSNPLIFDCGIRMTFQFTQVLIDGLPEFL